jgi:hypothetical protein
MVIFHSYVSLPEGKKHPLVHWSIPIKPQKAKAWNTFTPGTSFLACFVRLKHRSWGKLGKLPVVAMFRWFSPGFMVIFADFHGVFMGISQELMWFYGN